MKAIFLRALDETEDKSRAVLEAIASLGQVLVQRRFEVDPETFRKIPRSPFAYWVSDRVRALFSDLPPFESGERVARVGLQTSDDFRFVRLWWEGEYRHNQDRWFPFAKGEAVGAFYGDVPLQVAYSRGDQVALKEIGRFGRGADCYFRPGLTWTLRASRFGPRILPSNCIFSNRGQSCFSTSTETLALLGLFSSSFFDYLYKISLGRFGYPEFLVGVLLRLPLPAISSDEQARLAGLAREAWALRRSQDAVCETSHAFRLPALLISAGDSIAQRVDSWIGSVGGTECRVEQLQSEIDECSYRLYGIDSAERQQIERGLGGDSDSPDDLEGEQNEETEANERDVADLFASLQLWCVGVSFGRFDLRLATGERVAAPEPEPFDPLPVCSPGMLTGDDGLPLDSPPAGYAINVPCDGILVDDAGADCDLVARVRQVFETIFDDPACYWEGAAEILGDRDLRGWFACEFFELHIKRYSRSQRKAPIYWQLATRSASYSAWLYSHRFTRDTLFRLLNDHVAPKLQHEERKLNNLTQDAGPNPAASQRKEIEAQETFVGELRSFRDEVARVTPLWNPNLNDGVILNFAPLWRLVPQNKAWQKECKSAWDKLCKGDYDWAHLAMHLWPERVVPKCAEDRSLAIAHGLEEVFWLEDQDGQWRPKTVSDEEVESLVAERTSPAVKAALKSLLEAPAPVTGRGRTPRRKKTTTRRAKPAAPSDASAASHERAPRQSTATRIPDATVLDQVRSAITTLGGNAAKSDILHSTGLSASQWTRAINALLADGSVTKTGQKRGTRYHLAQDPS